MYPSDRAGFNRQSVTKLLRGPGSQTVLIHVKCHQEMRVAAADARNRRLDHVHSLAEPGVFNRKWHQESQHVIVRTRAYRDDTVLMAIFRNRFGLGIGWF